MGIKLIISLLLFSLFFIPTTIFSIPEDYDYKIWHDSNNIYLSDSIGHILDNQTFNSNDFIIFNHAMSLMSTNGGSLFIQRGIYELNGNILNVPPYVNIQGQGFGNLGYHETELRFTNGGRVAFTNNDVIQQVHLWFAQKTDYTDNVQFHGLSNVFRDSFVTSSSKSIGIDMYQTPGMVTGDNHFDNVILAGGYTALRLSNVTQNYFNDMVISTYDNSGIFLIGSDHNYFTKIQMTSPYNGIGMNHQDVVLGVGGDKMTLGNTFEALTLQVGDLNLVNNEKYQNRPNFVYVLGIDGPLKIYNGTSSAEKLIIDHRTCC